MHDPRETAVFDKHRHVNPPSERVRMIVNDIRHIRMDGIVFNAESNAEYRLFFVSVMGDIAREYPSLSKEVERQVRRKIARQDRRSNEIQGATARV